MIQPHVFSDAHTLAKTIAKQTLESLRRAIDMHDTTVWVLAGGTAPMLAYKIIADQHLNALDWSKVTFVIGDERIGPLDSLDNNWHAIEQVFLRHVPQATFMRPQTDQPAEAAAKEYEKQLLLLPQTSGGLPRLDIVWLGMGEDGHTLSLFPDHPDFAPTNHLVVPVHHAPKPPSDRISLTLHALAGAQQTMIITSGASKSAAVKQAFGKASNLPIAQAAAVTWAEWFVDRAAANEP